MALMYTTAKEAFLNGDINLASDTIKCLLVNSAHTPDADDEFLTDLGAVTQGSAATLGSKTTTAGAFDAANVTFTAVAAGAAVNKLIVYKHVVDATDSPVLAMLDLASAITPDGGNIVVAFDAAGLFAFTG